MSIKVDKILDAKGLACPMPIVKTKKMISELLPGQVMEIQATDKGSTADLKAWSESTGHQYLGTIDEDGSLKHYLRKATDEEKKEESTHPNILSLNELLDKLNGIEDIAILDVRESAEYAFGHIPNAISIPLGELEDRFNELKKDKDLYVICRSGSRSDMAARKLTDKGFRNVINVIPGMKDWQGPIHSDIVKKGDR